MTIKELVKEIAMESINCPTCNSLIKFTPNYIAMFNIVTCPKCKECWKIKHEY